MIYDVWLSQFYIHNKAEMIIHHREEFSEWREAYDWKITDTDPQ